MRKSRIYPQTDLGVYFNLFVPISTIACLILGFISQTSAQTGNSPILSADKCAINWNILKSNVQPHRFITADTVSPAAITLPSFWWTSEQFPNGAISNWIADTNRKEVYVLIEPLFWSNLDYVDRYQTLNRFGRVARRYGYNLNLCNLQKVALAKYICNLQPPGSSCQIWLNTANREGFGVRERDQQLGQ